MNDAVSCMVFKSFFKRWKSGHKIGSIKDRGKIG